MRRSLAKYHTDWELYEGKGWDMGEQEHANPLLKCAVHQADMKAARLGELCGEHGSGRCFCVTFRLVSKRDRQSKKNQWRS